MQRRIPCDVLLPQGSDDDDDGEHRPDETVYCGLRSRRYAGRAMFATVTHTMLVRTHSPEPHPRLSSLLTYIKVDFVRRSKRARLEERRMGWQVCCRRLGSPRRSED